MKKLLTVGLAALCLSLCGCGGNPDLFMADIKICTDAPIYAMSAQMQPARGEIGACAADGRSRLTGTVSFGFEELDFLSGEPGVLHLTVWANDQNIKRAADCCVKAPALGLTQHFTLTGNYQQGFVLQAK